MQKFYSYNDPLLRQRNVRSYNKKAMNTDVYKYTNVPYINQQQLKLHIIYSNFSYLTHWGRGHLNCLNGRSRGF